VAPTGRVSCSLALALTFGSLARRPGRASDRHAVQARDRTHESSFRFNGIDTYPIEPAWRIVGHFESYDPPCAFTDYATCSLPPRQNRLSSTITAGEKKYHRPH